MLLVTGEVDVLVVVFQGAVDDVQVFAEGKDARQAFKIETALEWDEYLSRIEKESPKYILGDWAGTTIHTTTLE